jgi:NAD(P)-dependent dehydrogenase (short-subunit alcohol dehydrogenase family)
MFSLKNKLALITGGGSGIGFEIARTFIEAGARVIITGRRIEMLENACLALGENANFIQNDVTQIKGHESLISEIESKFGTLDILVNNAGINLKKPALEVSQEEFDNIIQTNLSSVFSLSKAAAKGFIERGCGVILMISSMAAYYGIDRVVGYSAAKHGVEGLVKSFSADWASKGIRTNAIAPGFIETPMMLKAMGDDPDRRDKAMGRTPMKKWGKASDIAYAAVFLCSDEAQFITGVSLPVDGGNSIGF